MNRLPPFAMRSDSSRREWVQGDGDSDGDSDGDGDGDGDGGDGVGDIPGLH